MSRTPITARPAAPPRYSLVGVAETLTTLEERVFGAGWTTDPELCGNSRGGIVKADCFGSTDPLTAPANGGEVGDDPFVVWAADECSTMGSGRRDFEGRARRALLASQSFWIAQELADGAIRDNDTPTLTEAAIVTDGSEQTATDVLAVLESAAAITMKGERAMMHCTFGTLTHLAAENAIRRDGTLWVTPSDNVVVADAGYGTRFDGIGGDSLIVATSMISIALSPVDVVPGSYEQALAQMVDRSINLVTLYAQRSVVLVWDQCLNIAGTVPKYGAGS